MAASSSAEEKSVKGAAQIQQANLKTLDYTSDNPPQR